METYTYQPLPTPTSIRLLELVDAGRSGPGRAAGSGCSHGHIPLSYSLKIVELKDAPEYDALSYTWGNPLTVFPSKEAMLESERDSKRQYHIICDGRPLAVGHNLFDALHHLSYLEDQPEEAGGQTQSTPIWIDAICIDQPNLAERGAQVCIMGKIYRHATIVFAWLGEEDVFTKDALSAFDSLVEIVAKVGHEPARLIGKSPDDDFYRILGMPAISGHHWLALHAFFHRTWFHRAWVVQEIALSKRPCLMCGSSMRPWSRVGPVASFLFETQWDYQSELLASAAWPKEPEHTYPSKIIQRLHESNGPPVLYSSLPKDRQLTRRVLYMDSIRRSLGLQTTESNRNDPKRVDLSDLLHDGRATDAGDPRDKVYAFLGLSAIHEQSFHGHETLNLRPNYLRSTTEVYTDATRFIQHTRGDLKILSHVQIRRSTGTSDMPSWVPDYSEMGSPSKLDMEGSKWSASGSLTWQHSTIPDARLLWVQGSLVGSIRVVENDRAMLLASAIEFAAGLLSRQDSGNVREEILFPQPAAMHVKKGEAETPICSTRPSTVELLWRTLIADRLAGQQPAPLRCGFAFGERVSDHLHRFRHDRGIEEYEAVESLRTVLLKENRENTSIYLNWKALAGCSIQYWLQRVWSSSSYPQASAFFTMAHGCNSI
ncbi:hypothetical protein H2201_004014 [Coniosporium apollinis]|uniref:Heterokaryon incompatibility domain-containing protein n=1 Tax=Coniosporium apollinis TaxID=61459 RepID=A0ABQ9NX40_9PEZI|nr:hypothetical protein H2201_004014 [Coniosporium apollinis]